MELGCLNMAIKHFKHSITLVALELWDPGSEPAIDEQQLAARHRVSAHHRMLSARELHVGSIGRLDPIGMCLGAVMNRRALAQ